MNKFNDLENIGWTAVHLSNPTTKFVTGIVAPVDGGAAVEF